MPTSPDAILAAMQAEYGAMREEIYKLIDHEKDLVNLSFVLFGGVLGLIGTLLNGPVEKDVAFVLLLVPIVYLLFALTAAEQTRRILQIASYIHHDLRPKAEAVSGHEGLWAWEEWKSRQYRSLDRFGQLRVWVLERSRWIALTVPGVTALVAYGTLVGFESAPAVTMLVVDCTCIVVQIAIHIRTTEAPGIRHPE